MADATAPMTVGLTWIKDLEFTGHAGGCEVPIGGSHSASPTPVQYLALSLAGCMAIDLVHILNRCRHTLTALTATFQGERAADEPRRFTKITLHYTLATDAEPAVVDRAIQLSRDKYCSVWGSFRQDIELTVAYEIMGT